MKKIVQFFRAVFIIWRLGVDEILQLKKKALTDSLTGLYNRWYLYSFGAKQVEIAKRYKSPLSLIFLDINGFKKINDEEGHEFGDKVLISFSAFLVGCARRSDAVFRFGGDEFIIILPQTTYEEAKKITERLRRFSIYKISVSISVGISSISSLKGDSSLEKLIKEADEEMYKQKPRQ